MLLVASQKLHVQDIIMLPLAIQLLQQMEINVFGRVQYLEILFVQITQQHKYILSVILT